MKETLPSKLREWREAHGLTQEQFGRLIVIEGQPTKQSTVADWENRRYMPRREAMAAIKAATGGAIRADDFV
jgi:transcriptional regulator with XRE-family HTH domain